MQAEPLTLIGVGICVCLLVGAVAVGLFMLSRRRARASLHQPSVHMLPPSGEPYESQSWAKSVSAVPPQPPATAILSVPAQPFADAPTSQLGPRVTPAPGTA